MSWQEFEHQILAKGEVQRLVVRPEMDIVTIVLHDGAIIHGKQTRFRSYHMVLPDASNLEEKLRAAEQRLGIPSGNNEI